MMLKMDYYDYTNIRVIGGFGLLRLEKLTIDIEANQHGKAHFSGIVMEEVGFTDLEEPTEGQVIEIVQIDENGEKVQPSLFTGIVTHVAITQEAGFYHVETDLLSGTYLLDYQKKSRSFQDVTMTYADVVRTVLGDTEHAHAIFSVGEDVAIEKPVIQYEETDWEFIKRLASHFETVIVPEVTEIMPRLWFGPRQGEETISLEEEDYNAVVDGKYYQMGGGTQNRRRRDYLYFDVKSRANLLMGDSSTFHNQAMKICGKHAELARSELVFTYRLAPENWLKVKKYYNEKIQGLSLIGTVLETRDEVLKLHLDIDKEQNPGTAYEYDWVPTTGNLMYCMPQVGTRASLYFDNGDEQNARVINCVRTNGQVCPDTSDESKRCFTTEHKKRMYFHPDKMGMISYVGSDHIKLDDGSGITVSTPGKMTISAAGNINVQASTFLANSPQTIALIQGGAALTICNQFDIVGAKVDFFGEPGGGGGSASSAGSSSSATPKKPATKQWSNQATNAIAAIPTYICVMTKTHPQNPENISSIDKEDSTSIKQKWLEKTIPNSPPPCMYIMEPEKQNPLLGDPIDLFRNSAENPKPTPPSPLLPSDKKRSDYLRQNCPPPSIYIKQFPQPNTNDSNQNLFADSKLINLQDTTIYGSKPNSDTQGASLNVSKQSLKDVSPICGLKVNPVHAKALGAGMIATASLGPKGVASSPSDVKQYVAKSAASSSVGLVPNGSGNAAGPIAPQRVAYNNDSSLIKSVSQKPIGYNAIQEKYKDKYEVLVDNTYYHKPQIILPIEPDTSNMKKYKICLPASETYGAKYAPTAQDLTNYILVKEKKISKWEFSWAKFIHAFVSGHDKDFPEESCLGMKVNNVKLGNLDLVFGVLVDLWGSAYEATDITSLRINYLKNRYDNEDRIAIIEFGPPGAYDKTKDFADEKYHYQWSQSCSWEDNSDKMWSFYNTILKKDPETAARSMKIDPYSKKKYMDLRIRLDKRHKSHYPINISFQSGKIIFSQKYYSYNDRVEFVLTEHNIWNGYKKDDDYDYVVSIEDYFFGLITYPKETCEMIVNMIEKRGIFFADSSREYIYGPM